MRAAPKTPDWQFAGQALAVATVTLNLAPIPGLAGLFVTTVTTPQSLGLGIALGYPLLVMAPWIATILVSGGFKLAVATLLLALTALATSGVETGRGATKRAQGERLRGAVGWIAASASGASVIMGIGRHLIRDRL